MRTDCALTITSLDALVLLINTYSALTDDGIDVSQLRILEDELCTMPLLQAEDFEAVRVKWVQRDRRPLVRELMEDLQARNALHTFQRAH